MAEQLSAVTPHGSVDRKVLNKRLLEACEKGDVDEVKRLVSQGCKPNTIRGGRFGGSPLHEACWNGKLDTVKYLVDELHCDVNCTDITGWTLLHYCSRNGHLPVVQYLCEEKNSNVNCTDKFGQSPLHLSCKNGHLPVVQYLCEERHCDVNCTDKFGQTLLHLSCRNGHLPVVQYLCEERQCDVNCTTNIGETPLHLSCESGHLPIVQYLCEERHCDVNCTDNIGQTPLRLSCLYGQLEVVQYLCEEQHCDINCTDNDGQTPLHHCCQNGELEVLRYLCEDQHCDINCTDNDGQTLLHHCCQNGELEVLRYLCEDQHCDINCTDKYGLTLLHHCCQWGQLKVVRYLCEEQHCDINCTDNDGQTLLHHCCRRGQLKVLRYLCEEQHCDINCTDKYGRTLLHHCCRKDLMHASFSSELLEYILRYLKCDTNQTTKSGKTALEFAANEPDAVRLLLMYGAKPPYENWSKYLQVDGRHQPAEAYAKMILLGFPGGGKSSLAKCFKIQTRAMASRVVNRLRKVPDVDLRTAGIITDDIISEQFGRMSVYDLAGHSEFYASHDVTLRNALSGSSSSIILLVSDMRGGSEPFRKSVMHWCGFAENLFERSDDNGPYLILVGSHADQASSAEIRSCQAVVQSLKDTASFSNFRFKGFVTLDCRYAESSRMTLLRSDISECCQALKQEELISFRENCYLVFLLERFVGKPAVTISKVISECTRTDHPGAKYIPTDPGSMADICSQLNRRGNILFLPDEANQEDSWIVLQKDVLLNRLTGSIFAPSGFKEHLKDMATDTGIIPSSKLSSYFPDLDRNLIVPFVCHLQFCHVVKDPEILQQLSVDHSELGQQFLFFPGLVTIAVPRENVWDSNVEFTHQSVWFLQCRNPDQSLSARFLHITVHRLAFSFAMAHSTSNASDQVSIHRMCSVWKNGIFWRSLCGIDALLEVIEQKKLVLYVRSRRHYELDAVCLRSSVISKVLQALREYCPKVKVDECFVHHDSIQYPLAEATPVVSMTNLAKSIISCQPFAHDTEGQVVEIDGLLHFESLANFGEGILRELFTEDDSDVKDAFLAQLVYQAHSNTDKYMRLLDIKPYSLDTVFDTAPPNETHKLLRVFQLWRNREGSYANLRSALSTGSVFAGRNPFDLLIKK